MYTLSYGKAIFDPAGYYHSYFGLHAESRTYALGTPEEEFKKHDKFLTASVEQSPERTVYKRLIGQEGNRNSYSYYYFVDGKLVRMDEGERQLNVVIEHVKG